MQPSVLPDSSRSLYRDLLVQAETSSSILLSRVLEQARQSMRADVQRKLGSLERDHLELAIKMLDLQAAQLCERFPKALAQALRQHAAPDTRVGVISAQGLRLDQLELMDELQVQERVEVTRALQHVLLIAEGSLAELNTYVSALLGLSRVNAERNPLRPVAYVSALQSLMLELSLPPLVRMAWFLHASSPLGESLSKAYHDWATKLQGQGVQAVSFSLVRTPGKQLDDKRQGVQRKDREVWSPQHRQRVLTLARLRRLVAGELEAVPNKNNSKEVFARQFEREFESPQDCIVPETSFESTVPAAFEALQEMQQVDKVVQRMTQRPGALLAQAETSPVTQSAREQLMAQARGIAQSLSVEVMALMVDNLVQDVRLLEPLRDIIARLEPALLRLVLVDTRFFSDRKHPARCLLQEISQRGLAFCSVEDPNFNAFLASLQRFVSPLASLDIENAEPFDLALKSLMSLWAEAETDGNLPGQINSVVAVLEYAEERNLLAEKMVVEMHTIADLHRVPQSVVDFLFGPWAQVMACAQLNDRSGDDDPKHYKALVNTLLWSAQPELTRKRIDKLTKLVPRLLSGLREGLRMIDYPSIKTSAFFDVLMKLHQQAFRPASNSERCGLPNSLRGDQDHWVAPAEVKASGFMAMPEDIGTAVGSSNLDDSTSNEVSPNEEKTDVLSLSVGSWVELKANGIWIRSQLSWVSPQRSMYLFTTGQGKTQSMTKRMLQRMLSTEMLRVLSDQSMVDHALDAVVQTAMLNSLDIKFE